MKYDANGKRIPEKRLSPEEQAAKDAKDQKESALRVRRDQYKKSLEQKRAEEAAERKAAADKAAAIAAAEADVAAAKAAAEAADAEARKRREFILSDSFPTSPIKVDAAVFEGLGKGSSSAAAAKQPLGVSLDGPKDAPSLSSEQKGGEGAGGGGAEEGGGVASLALLQKKLEAARAAHREAEALADSKAQARAALEAEVK